MLRKLAVSFALACSLLWCAGWGANLLVESVNDNLMPVRVSECSSYPGVPVRFDAIHVCEIPATHLRWLDDWVDMGDSILSPGDFSIEAARLCAILASLTLIGSLIARLDKKPS